MELKVQKKLAGAVLKCSKSRIRFDPERLDEIKEAITKVDIKALIIDNAISRKPVNAASRFRARKKIVQKRKGRQKGPGSRKGKRTARLPKKRAWINQVRIQREFLKYLRDKGIIDKRVYRDLYLKCKGGFFRSKRHLKLYIDEHGLIKK
ncbi:50S ribosomal protein L19e [Candidatus Woesearchaeota archaeon]|nr:50S ribosomal protein L19e [Candidatus Woesearchaeota archaeon]